MMTARWTDRRALQDAKDEQEARHVRITIAIRVAPRDASCGWSLGRFARRWQPALLHHRRVVLFEVVHTVRGDQQP